MMFSSLYRKCSLNDVAMLKRVIVSFWLIHGYETPTDAVWRGPLLFVLTD